MKSQKKCVEMIGRIDRILMWNLIWSFEESMEVLLEKLCERAVGVIFRWNSGEISGATSSEIPDRIYGSLSESIVDIFFFKWSPEEYLEQNIYSNLYINCKR